MGIVRRDATRRNTGAGSDPEARGISMHVRGRAYKVELNDGATVTQIVLLV